MAIFLFGALWLVGALFALAPAGLVAARWRRSGLFYALCALTCAGLAAIGLFALLGAIDERLALPFGLPLYGAHVRLDPLASFFLVLVNVAGAAASFYAIGYGAHDKEPARILPFYPAFLAGMNGVVLADDCFSFFLCWEAMSLASFALVLAHHRTDENRFAAFLYLGMATFGGLALLLAFALLAGLAGAMDFSAIAALQIAPAAQACVFVLALLGAGSKAGLVPLHVWLPLAHPAAPSHVSALMSGAMTKVAIYGFVRIVFTLGERPALGESLAVIALGAATAVYGALWANVERDMKRILACSTIENIGFIFCGLGLAMAFRANGVDGAAALALTAALLHALNHSWFKSLLFMSAGAVIGATGTGDLEKLGGLVHRMKATSALALGGAMAIAALPPLNGFVSEWLIFQSVLVSPVLPQWPVKLLAPAAGVALALSAALSAAVFVRLYGVAFLSRPRSQAAADAREADRFSLIAMGALLALCAVAGLMPGLLMDAMRPLALALTGAAPPQQIASAFLTLTPIAENRSSYNAPLILGFVLVAAALTSGLMHRFGSRLLRRTPAWDCGYPETSAAAQYTAASFAQPIRRAFSGVAFSAREEIDMPEPLDKRAARLSWRVRDIVWERLYAPLGAAFEGAALLFNRTHFWTVRAYLSLMFAALVVLLIAVALWN